MKSVDRAVLTHVLNQPQQLSQSTPEKREGAAVVAQRLSRHFTTPLKVPASPGVTDKASAGANEAEQATSAKGKERGERNSQEMQSPSLGEAFTVLRRNTRNSRRPAFLRENSKGSELSLSELPNPANEPALSPPLLSPTVTAGAPEEMIHSVLSKLAPEDLHTQLELLTDSLLKTHIEYAVAS